MDSVNLASSEAREDPRVTRTRSVVLTAAAKLFYERGFSRFSIEELVQRTGVSKTTIYRHWPSRRDLIAAAISHIKDRRVLPDTGSLRSDLVTFFQDLKQVNSEGQDRWSHNLPSLIEAAEQEPELLFAIDGVITGLLAKVRTMLERGRLRGELRADVDLDVAISIVVGAFFVRSLLLRATTTAQDVENTVDAVLRGLAEPA